MNKHLLIPFVAAAALVLTGGLIHGRWTNRWGDSAALRYSVVSLPRLPLVIGDWEGKDIPPTEEQARTFVTAELRVAVVRSYRHRKTGLELSLMAVCGPPGPIGTHTPEACYNGGGYTMAYLQQRPTFGVSPGDGKPNVFWCDDFRNSSPTNRSGLKIYWSFRPGVPNSHWEAASQPRADFAPYDALYKIYVIRPMAMLEPSPVPDEVTPGFIRDLVPALEAAVFAPMSANSSVSTKAEGSGKAL